METTAGNVHVGNIDELISELEAQFGEEMELGAQSNDDILSGGRCTNNCTDGVRCHTEKRLIALQTSSQRKEVIDLADTTEIILTGDIDELIVELEAQFGADMELSSSFDPDTQTHGCTYGCTVTSGCATN